MFRPLSVLVSGLSRSFLESESDRQLSKIGIPGPVPIPPFRASAI